MNIKKNNNSPLRWKKNQGILIDVMPRQRESVSGYYWLVTLKVTVLKLKHIWFKVSGLLHKSRKLLYHCNEVRSSTTWDRQNQYVYLWIFTEQICPPRSGKKTTIWNEFDFTSALKNTFGFLDTFPHVQILIHMWKSRSHMNICDSHVKM